MDKSQANELDLNLDNYKLSDVIGLFGIPVLYEIEDLRRAKQIVAATHPDKCDLPSEYFMFFKSAYQVLVNIYRQRCRNETTVEQITAERGDDATTATTPLPDSVPKDGRSFTNWFNQMYDESVTPHDKGLGGHGDWLRAADDTVEESGTFAEMVEKVREKKRNQYEIIPGDRIESIGGRGFAILGSGETDLFEGDIFSQLGYDDVRRAYTESIVPVDEVSELARRTNHKSIESLRQERDRPIGIPDKQTAEGVLSDHRSTESEYDTHRFYEMSRETERARKIKHSWDANMLRIGF
jgi:hypothetical protein